MIYCQMVLQAKSYLPMDRMSYICFKKCQKFNVINFSLIFPAKKI